MAGYPSSETFDVQEELSWDKLQRIICDCVVMGVKAVEITGGGEPTVHPHFNDLCSLIVDSGIDLGVVTNGSIWSPRHAETLARAHWVRFSIDAGTATTYASYRQVSPVVYRLVRDHVRQLTDMQCHPDSLIGVGYVVNADNWRDVLQAAEYAKDNGADNFRISALFQPQGRQYFETFFGEARDLCKKAEGLATDTFTVFNLFGDRLGDLESGPPTASLCGYSRLTTYLGADSTAYTCCCNAYSAHGLIGSFRNQSFRRMWEAPTTQEKLLAVDATQCQRCMYNTKNETIAYAIDKNPKHINFI